MRFSDFKRPIEFSQSVHQFMKMINEGISAAKALKQQKNGKKDLIHYEYFKDETERIQRKYKFPATFREAQIHARAVKFGYVPPELEMSATGGNMLKVCPCCLQPISTEEIPLNYNTTDVPEMPNKDSSKFKDFEPFKLQASISLFFLFIKMAIIYLTIIFCVYSIYSFSHAMDSALCTKYQCKKEFFSTMLSNPSSSQYKRKLTHVIQDLLGLLTVILSISFFFVYRRFQIKLYDEIDSQINSQDDYTIFVENIPVYDFPPGFDITTMPKDKVLSFNYESKLKKIFEDHISEWILQIEKKKAKNTILKKIESNAVNHIMQRNKLTFYKWKNQTIKVQSISLCYDLSDLNKINAERQVLIDKVIKLGQLVEKHLKRYYEKQLKIQELQKININKYKLEKYRLEWQKIKKKAFKQTGTYQTIKATIDQLNNRVIALNTVELSMNYDFAHNRTPIFNLTHFVGKALVSFEYKHYREFIVRKYENGWDQFKYPGTDVKLKISRAPHPRDINWINMNVTTEERKNRIITSFLIMLMGLIFSGFILVLLSSGKGEIINFGKNRKFLNDMLNYILSILSSTFISYLNLYVSVYSEKLTQYESHHIMANQYASMIAKTLLIQFLNTAFIFWLIQFIQNMPFTGSEGLIVQISTLIIINSIKTVGLKVIQHKCWKVILNRRYHDDQDYSKYTFQSDLNKNFQFPVFDITDRYADYLLQLYTILLYCYLIPIGALAGIVNFVIQYWVDKVILFKFSSMYHYPGVQLSRLILKFLQGSLVLFTFGCLTFSWRLADKFPILNMISFVISVLYLVFTILMSEKTERWLFGQAKIESDSYSSVHRTLFQQTYWTENPATSFICEKNLNNKKEIIEDQRPKMQFADPKQDWTQIAHFGLRHKESEDNLNSEESEYEEDEYDMTSTYCKRHPVIPKNFPDVDARKEMEIKSPRGNQSHLKMQQNYAQTNLLDDLVHESMLKSKRHSLISPQLITHGEQRLHQSQRNPGQYLTHLQTNVQISQKKHHNDESPYKEHQQQFVSIESESEQKQPMNHSKKSNSSNIFQHKSPSQEYVQQEINEIIGNEIVPICEFTTEDYYETQEPSETENQIQITEPMNFAKTNSLIQLDQPDLSPGKSSKEK